MIDRVTVGASCLMAALTGATWLARWAVRPTGQHPATPEPMLRPIEALHRVERWCCVEHRPTLHIALTTGGLMCMDCRTTTSHTIQGDQ